MAIPDGYKSVEQIAVEFAQSLNRIQTAIRELDIVQKVFSDDRRRRYYSPEDIEQIRTWLAGRVRK